MEAKMEARISDVLAPVETKKVAKDPVQSLQITIFFECDAA
jgi:hypothetical protein